MPSSTRPARASRSCDSILVDTQLPGSVQTPGQDVPVRLGQPNVGPAHPAPATGYWNEEAGRLSHELRLDLRRERQVPETVFDGSQRGKNSPAHPEVHRTHVRSLLSAIEAQGDSSKVGGGHLAIG